MINSKQALEILKQTKRCNDNMVADAKEKKAFGAAFDIAIQAVEKQTPINPINVDTTGTHTFECPTCNKTIIYLDDKHRHKHCLNCGQAFKW